VPSELPDEVATYAARIGETLAGLLGAELEAVYLHGSAVLGGFRLDRSDVDVLAIVRAPLGRTRLAEVAEAVSHRRLANPACGLELDMITVDAARRPRHPSRFELNLNSAADGDKVVLGEDHGPSTDTILHLAVTRAAGLALVGPPPAEIVAEVPRTWLLGEFRNELDWARERGSTAYQALNAARVWRYGEEDVICTKLDGARWALGRGYDHVLLAAIEFQEGRTERLPDSADAAGIVARAQAAVRAARRGRVAPSPGRREMTDRQP
jgi:Nucleotidyltransferase domain